MNPATQFAVLFSKPAFFHVATAEWLQEIVVAKSVPIEFVWEAII